MSSEATRERIIAAAHRCIARHGIGGTSLGAVAREAGVHRQTIYLLFANREDLFRAVVLRRLDHLATSVQGKLDLSRSFAQAIVDGTVETLRLARSDAGLMAILHSLHDVSVDGELIAAGTEINAKFAAIWQPAFLHAKRRGELVANRSFEDFSEWLRGVQYVLLMRPELSAAQQRRLLRLFIDPGLAARD